MEHFDGPRPPKPGPRRYLIVGPKPGQKFSCIPVSNVLCCRETHWMDRTVLCSGTPNCNFCLQHMRKTWRGWLPCVELLTKGLFILDLPSTPGRFIETLIDQGSDLRKLKLIVSRPGGKKCSKVEITCEHGFKPPWPVPPPFDPWPTVAAMFGLSEKSRDFRLTTEPPSVN
jgi:hypothetical protein